MYMTKTHSKEMDSHSYKHVHDKTDIARPMEQWASKRNGSHSHRNVHDDNPFKRNGSHSYRNVHDNNSFRRDGIIRTVMYMKTIYSKSIKKVICTETCMTTIHSKKKW